MTHLMQDLNTKKNWQDGCPASILALRAAQSGRTTFATGYWHCATSCSIPYEQVCNFERTPIPGARPPSAWSSPCPRAMFPAARPREIARTTSRSCGRLCRTLKPANHLRLCIGPLHPLRILPAGADSPNRPKSPVRMAHKRPKS